MRSSSCSSFILLVVVGVHVIIAEKKEKERSKPSRSQTGKID